MKKFIILYLAFVLVFASLIENASAVLQSPSNSAESIIVVQPDSGSVLLEKNADQKMLIASTTKMMTALIVLENCSCNEKVEIKKEYTNIEGSSLYLRSGEIFTVKELLYGLMLASGNDTAVALAYHTAGGIEKFAELMNNKADELGLKNSSFKNPHGLDEEGHYSTARDLAVIASAAMENEEFREIVSTKSIAVHERVLANHNKLLWKYKGVQGIKTGYTMKSGRSLVSYAEREGMPLIIVTINDRNDWEDHMKLFDWGFENFELKKIAVPGETSYEVPVISGETDTVTVSAAEDLNVLITEGEELEIKIFLPEFIFAPVRCGDIIGSIKVTINGETAGETELICTENSEVDKQNTLNFLQKTFKSFRLIFEN